MLYCDCTCEAVLGTQRDGSNRDGESLIDICLILLDWINFDVMDFAYLAGRFERVFNQMQTSESDKSNTTFKGSVFIFRYHYQIVKYFTAGNSRITAILT